MTAPGQDDDEPPATLSTSAPAPALIPGRRISLDTYGVKKLPSINGSSGTEVDDFGLPVQRRTSQVSSREELDRLANGESDIKSSGANNAETNSTSRMPESEGGKNLNAVQAGEQRDRRDTSATRRAGNIGQKREDGLTEGDETADESRGRAAATRSRSKSAQRIAAARSRSLGEGTKISSRPNSRGSIDQRRRSATVEDDSSNDWRRSRSDTLTKIQESGPATTIGGVSEWSHQVLAPRKEEALEEKEEEWQAMPALGEYDVYDDEGRLVAKANKELDDDDLDGGGAGKGYTRVQVDDDAKSTTSMDENTSYLFKEKGTNVVDEDEDQRDPLAQMQATKGLLTEGQRIAYVGVARLAMIQMLRDLEKVPAGKALKKESSNSTENLKKWSQMMMVRLYSHMDIDAAEQIMIEQLAEHGVRAADLTPALMQNARVKNPVAEADATSLDPDQPPSKPVGDSAELHDGDSPPAYENEDLSEVKDPTELPATKKIDIDIRWTILCDLFLVLIADSVYDSRSRVLLETVGESLEVKWVDICRFEKRVTDALEMQEQALRENWDEAEHMEARRKKALKRKYMYMGLATVGGSLIIGLSAGLLAPVIGAGLAAGFTTIGVAGTSGFLAGAGGTALITTIGVSTGGAVAVKASNRRMGAVRTFEYRPLHNNKRVNLIVTISGWMTGKVDDVRLPFSTVDPIMGDIYSLHWEPDMLQSMGDTIRILATEALTQGLQQVLAATILTALMASLTLPIWLLKLSYLLDNPWSVSLDRSDSAGLILADSLIDRNLGARPITLVGFSLGARVVFSCLKELASKGAYGLIQNVYLFGSPVVANKDEYLKARTVIAGRFVNAYSTSDWILGYLFRATKGGISQISGLAAVDSIPGLENVDVTSFVEGHMAYRTAMPRLLRYVGWEVESDEFAEIADPDPDNHEGRQRQLIREIEEARKEAQAKPEKRRFGFFKRGKLAQKKSWEMYDEKMGEARDRQGSDAPDLSSNSVLFDIEAIKRELASEHMEVRQLESTLPPMQISLNNRNMTVPSSDTVDEKAKSAEIPQTEFPAPLRSTKSFDATALPSSADSDGARLSAAARESPGKDQADDHSENQSSAPDEKSLAPSQGSQSNSSLPSAMAWQENNKTAARPELRSANTMPVENNAWADEEEEQARWAKEGEVVMSFE